mmetsp:Transcript_16673/g.41036  ORF Transcript_16673/g.41036 Transcript_16673/m.41036 type:complete len:211 (+) Transcript_16673:834-1466(+)
MVASENTGVSHRNTADDTAEAPTVYALPKRHAKASSPASGSLEDPTKMPPPLPGCAGFPCPYPNWLLEAMKFAPATVTSVPPEASPVGGNKTSGAAAAWYSNITPKVVKLPGPALTSTETKPTWCGGARHTAVAGVTWFTPVTLASTGVKPKRQLNAGCCDSMAVGTKFPPCTVTTVPPVPGPWLGSSPNTSSCGPKVNSSCPRRSTSSE